MNKLKKSIRFIAVTVVLSMLISLFAGCSSPKSEMRDISTMELVREMGLGINLGNTFESCGGWISNTSVTNYETGWGSPVITQEMIQGYADSGFGVLRVPVAWSNMMTGDYDINPNYLSRVR